MRRAARGCLRDRVLTPFHKDGRHTSDVPYVLAAVKNVAGVLKAGDTIILDSTSPVGRTEAMRDTIAQERADLRLPGLCEGTPDVAVPHRPERVLPERILEKIGEQRPADRWHESALCKEGARLLQALGAGTCLTTHARLAEMTKLVENAYRNVNIAFANELSIVADAMSSDVWEVIRVTNRHRRVNILSPAGCGRPLHPDRSVAHRPQRAERDAAHSHRARGQRQQDSPCDRPCDQADRNASAREGLTRPRL